MSLKQNHEDDFVANMSELIEEFKSNLKVINNQIKMNE